MYFEGNSKYYVTDIGLRNALLDNNDRDLGHILENVVYLELKRRSYDVSVEKLQKYTDKTEKEKQKI